MSQIAAAPTSAPAARTISLLNMKGGVGKTTLAVNLAWHLCRRGRKRVLLVDLDPQFNSSQYLMTGDEWESHRKHRGTVADVLIEPHTPRMSLSKKPPKPVPVSKYIFRKETRFTGGRLDLLPSELALSKAVKNPDRVPYRLEKALETIRGQYDFIFIDCAPTDSVLTDTALMASDFVMVPTRPDRFSVLGYALLQETFESFRAALPDPHRVKDLGVVLTQVVGGSDIESQTIQDITDAANYVFNTQIPQSRSYLRALHGKTPVFDTRYTRSFTKFILTSLVNEMNTRIATLEKGAVSKP